MSLGNKKKFPPAERICRQRQGETMRDLSDTQPSVTELGVVQESEQGEVEEYRRKTGGWKKNSDATGGHSKRRVGAIPYPNAPSKGSPNTKGRKREGTKKGVSAN